MLMYHHPPSPLAWSDVPAALRAWRAALGLSQSAAAKRLGVPPRTYQEWEHGRSAPSQIGLLRVACAAVEEGIDLNIPVMPSKKR